MHRPMRFGLLAAGLAMIAALPGLSALRPERPRFEQQRRRRQARQAFRDLLRDRHHKNWPYCGERQRKRYARQRADERQRNSHKPGTVQPFHIFGKPGENPHAT